MYYIKAKIGHNVNLEVGFDGDVYTRCAVCGKELRENLVDLVTLAGGDIDLAASTVTCEECTAKQNTRAFAVAPAP